MKSTKALIIGISIGVVIGVLIAILSFYFIRCHRKKANLRISSSRRASTLPICADDTDSALSDSPRKPKRHGLNFWFDGLKKPGIAASGIPEYSYKDLVKATSNFTTILGQGAFGSVYKAQLPSGETVAVKVLGSDSQQGEREFHSEVMLLGRLHHRNLVNLIGYCAEKGRNILVYVYMSNGSLFSHLYGAPVPMTWTARVIVALDVARGLEYLHDGAIPPVIHRDIKSSNILLDNAMRARVADFGLSREIMVGKNAANLRGTFGYLDPEYVSTNTFTKKSDVYSFGILLFELITGRNPQQGLIDYVELAAISTEGKVGWEEIADSRLEGRYNVREVDDVAALAYKCVNASSKKRPSMRDVVLLLSRIVRGRQFRATSFSDVDGLSESKTPVSDLHRRVESVDSVTTLDL